MTALDMLTHRTTLEPIPHGDGITCIVSTHCRPRELNLCILSLILQLPRVQIIVTDNSIDQKSKDWTKAVCKHTNVNYMTTSTFREQRECYDSANIAAPLAIGNWLCFPSDDGYHVPQWSRIVLETATQHPDWDLIYWDTLYDPRRTGKYEVMVVYPSECQIDKTSFMVKRSLFMGVGGFPERPHDNWRDAELINKLMSIGVKHGKAPGVLCVHS